VEFGKQRDTRTNGQQYPQQTHQLINQVSAWQAEQESRPTS